MSCYHPLLGVPEYKSEKGNWCFVPRGPFDRDIASTWTWLSEENKDGSRPQPIMIPCGKCIGCRLDQSRAWADRMMLELDYSKKAIFVTLTYDNDNVPFVTDEYTGEFGCLSLCKRDFQLFMKRLRKRFSDNEIRFFLAGEYGSRTFRPHGHAIIFGLSLDDFPDRRAFNRNKLGQVIYTSDCLERIWNNGFTTLADVSWETCAYVARYVQKKVFSASDFLYDAGAEPEFSLSSRRPGIGGHYLEDHPGVFEASKIFVPGKPDGVVLPAYFLKKLKQENSFCFDPELYDKIKMKRKEFADDRMLLKLQQTDLSMTEQLELEENQKLRQSSVLKRHLM